MSEENNPEKSNADAERSVWSNPDDSVIPSPLALPPVEPALNSSSFTLPLPSVSSFLNLGSALSANLVPIGEALYSSRVIEPLLSVSIFANAFSGFGAFFSLGALSSPKESEVARAMMPRI
jgi:hypothetical protein